jgi:hypothetical protein
LRLTVSQFGEIIKGQHTAEAIRSGFDRPRILLARDELLLQQSEATKGEPVESSLAMHSLPLFDADAAMGDGGSLPAARCGELAPPASAGVSKKQIIVVSNETGDTGNRQISRE